MPASQEQKVDFLLKKIGYSASKTGIAEDESVISSSSNTPKKPFEEAIPSPLIIPSTSLWSDSSFIPTTPPASDTAFIKVYSTSSALRMTRDTSVGTNTRTYIAYTTYNNTSSARLTNWIDTQFGADYILKVYKDDPTVPANELTQVGANNQTDGWFFDYSSGVLNFNGTNLPSGITATNIYIVGYRYIGGTGAKPPAGFGTFHDLYVSGFSTFVNDITANKDVIISGNLTVNGTQTILNTASLEVEDINVGIASTTSKLNNSQIDGAGITIYSSDGDKTITWDNSNSWIGINTLFYATRYVGAAVSNVIPFYYDNASQFPSSSTYHGAVAHAHNTGKLYFAHNGWNKLVNVESNGIVGTGTEQYHVGILTANGNAEVTGELSVAEKIVHTGDTDSFIKFTDNQIDIQTNAQNKVRIGTGASIGIHDDSLRAVVIGTGNSNNVLIRPNNGASNNMGNSDAVNNLIVMRVPYGESAASQSNAGMRVGMMMRLFNGNSGFGDIDPTKSASVYAVSEDSSKGYSRVVGLSFYTSPFNSSQTEKLRISGSGNVGIGSTLPTHKLEVNGNTLLKDNLKVTGISTFSNTTFTGTVYAGSSTGDSGQYLRSTGVGVTWATFPSTRSTDTQTATSGQTSFNFTYTVGYLDVFVNGVKLPPSEFTASNGSTVILNDAAFANDTLEFVSYYNAPGSGTGAQNLTSLADVNITSPVYGQTLRHNGVKFVNDFHPHLTTASTSQVSITNLPIASYRSAEYLVQVTEGTKYHVTKIIAIHDGTNVTFNEYGTVTTSTSLATFSLDINSGSMRLLATPASSNSTTFKVKFDAIAV